MSVWIKSNPIKAGLSAAALLVVALATAAELTGRFDDPCPQSYPAAERQEEPSGPATMAQSERTSEHNSQTAQECPAPDWWGVPSDGWIALLTLVLAGSTIGLWNATYELGARADTGLRRLERAYIHFNVYSQGVKSWLHGREREGVPLLVQVQARNLGKTPAYLLSGECRLVIEGKDHPEVTNSGEFDMLLDSSVMGMGEMLNRAHTVSLGRGVTPDDKLVATGQLILKLIGEIRYRDIWGRAYVEHWAGAYNTTRDRFEMKRWESRVKAYDESPNE